MLRQLRPYVLYPALALGSFVAVARGVRSLVPWPEGLGLRNKMEFFEAHRDDYDALIIGSSRSFRGLDPLIIDEVLASGGYPLRTFNLALGGMRSYEQDFLLHHVLDLGPARLKWIFYEGGPLGMGLRSDHIFRDPVNLWSERGVLWHTPASTAKVLRAIRRLPLSLSERWRQALVHLELFGWRMVNYGKGEELIRHWRGNSVLDARRAEIKRRTAAGRGHQGLEVASGREMGAEKVAFLEDPTPFEERMAAIPAENELPCALEELNLNAYRAQVEAAEERGVVLLYFTPPGFEGSPERLRVHEAGVVPGLVHLNDPGRYPELFQLDHRYDKGHLNRRGTERLSRLLAEGILEHMEANDVTPPVEAVENGSDDS